MLLSLSLSLSLFFFFAVNWDVLFGTICCGMGVWLVSPLGSLAAGLGFSVFSLGGQ